MGLQGAFAVSITKDLTGLNVAFTASFFFQIFFSFFPPLGEDKKHLAEWPRTLKKLLDVSKSKEEILG